jgi:hypothetical protein
MLKPAGNPKYYDKLLEKLELAAKERAKTGEDEKGLLGRFFTTK